MAYALTNINMNTAAMNSAMSQAINMFGHYNHQEYILQELNPLMKPKPEPAHIPHTQAPPSAPAPAPTQNNMPHECQTCQRRFAQKQTLIQHMTTHTGIKAFQCQLCFKNFTQQGSLQRHMAIHNNERPYPCEICNKAFRQKSHLTNHAKSHVDQRMYKCTQCNKSFNRADHCKRHMLTHATNRPIYTCFFCNKEFKEKYLMKTHIKKKLCFQETTRTRKQRDGHPDRGERKEKTKREKILFQCEHCYKNFHRCTKEFSNKYLEKYCKNCCPLTEPEKFTFYEEEVYICSICNGPPYTKLKTYNRHMALHSEDRKFECEICHLRFQKKYLLRYHLNVHNNVKDYQCQLCGLQFETMIKLRDHYCHHPEHADYLATFMKIYQCHHCDKIFVRRTNCVKHCRSHMNIPRRSKNMRKSEYPDDETEQKPNANRVSLARDSDINKYDHFLMDKNLARNIQEYDDDDHYMGDDAFADDDSPPESQDRKNFNNHPGNYYQQPFNNFNSKTGNQENEQYGQNGEFQNNSQTYSHFDTNQKKCGQIPISALPFANVPNNIQAYGPVEIEHHEIEDLVITSKPRDEDSNPAPFHCYVCKKKYRHKKQLVRHFQVNHTNDYDRVVCDICNKEFTHKSSLVEHKLLHLPPKHECPVCQKRFNRKYSLKRHMLLHKGERPFHCNLCEASFNHKKSLEIHLLKHQGILPFECNICNKRYVDKGTLSRHYLVHSGERKFVCHLCDLRFSQKIHLSKHYLTHDEIEKKLVLTCPTCMKQFFTKFNYARHLETHSKKKCVTCTTCGKQFKFENGYERHMQKGKCKGKPSPSEEKGKKGRKKRDEGGREKKKKRQKQGKKKGRRQSKWEETTSEEEEEEEEGEYDEEELAEVDKFIIKAEALEEEETEVSTDVKQVLPHVNADYSENFDSEVEEIPSTKKFPSRRISLIEVKNELSIGPQFETHYESESEAVFTDQYIVPDAILTTAEQYSIPQSFTPGDSFGEQHSADWNA